MYSVYVYLGYDLNFLKRKERALAYSAALTVIGCKKDYAVGGL